LDIRFPWTSWRYLYNKPGERSNTNLDRREPKLNEVDRRYTLPGRPAPPFRSHPSFALDIPVALSYSRAVVESRSQLTEP